MATALEPFQVVFPEPFDARAEYEASEKGYLTGVQVQLSDGSLYRLTFYDPIRLQQTLTDDIEAGRPYFTEPGLVIVPEVTAKAIRLVVERLWRDGFFQHLKPVA